MGVKEVFLLWQCCWAENRSQRWCLLKVEDMRCGGRGPAVPPVWKRLQACLISHSHSTEWAMRMFTSHSTYPPWALMGLPCYFLHALALLDSCEGLIRLLAAHGVPFHLSPAHWASCKPGRLRCPSTPSHQVICPTPSRPWLVNGSTTPKTSWSFPSHSHRPGTPIPSCQSERRNA